MPQAARFRLDVQGALLQDFLEDGADPVAVFLLKPSQEDGASAGFGSIRSQGE